MIDGATVNLVWGVANMAVSLLVGVNALSIYRAYRAERKWIGERYDDLDARELKLDSLRNEIARKSQPRVRGRFAKRADG